MTHGLSWWLSAKESACHYRRCRLDLWVVKISWRRKWQPTPVSLPRKSHGQRSLVGYSPWGCKKQDMTERLTLHHIDSIKFVQSLLTSNAAAVKSLQSCPTLCDPIDKQPSRLPHPWDSPGKNTGVGYHFLLQCMKVKSESEVTQSCPNPSDPMDCSPPGSSVHGILQAMKLE